MANCAYIDSLKADLLLLVLSSSNLQRSLKGMYDEVQDDLSHYETKEQNEGKRRNSRQTHFPLSHLTFVTSLNGCEIGLQQITPHYTGTVSDKYLSTKSPLQAP